MLARRRARRRRSSRRGGSRPARARRRTASCPPPSAGRAPAAAPRCRPGAARRTARRARRPRRTGSTAPASPAAAAAARPARASACCARASGSRGRGRAGRRAGATRSCGDPPGDHRLLRVLRRAASPARRRPVRVRAEDRRPAASAAARDISAMSSPANVTDSASRPEPLAAAAGQSALDQVLRAPASSSAALSVLANVCSTYRRALVNVPMVARLLLPLERPPHLRRACSRRRPARAAARR